MASNRGTFISKLALGLLVGSRNARIFNIATFVKYLGWGVHVLGPQNVTAHVHASTNSDRSTHWAM